MQLSSSSWSSSPSPQLPHLLWYPLHVLLFLSPVPVPLPALWPSGALLMLRRLLSMRRARNLCWPRCVRWRRWTTYLLSHCRGCRRVGTVCGARSPLSALAPRVWHERVKSKQVVKLSRPGFPLDALPLHSLGTALSTNEAGKSTVLFKAPPLAVPTRKFPTTSPPRSSLRLPPTPAERNRQPETSTNLQQPARDDSYRDAGPGGRRQSLLSLGENRITHHVRCCRLDD